MWRSSEREGLFIEVDAELKWDWDTMGSKKTYTIARVDTFFLTNGWCVQRLSVTAGRVEEIEWQRGEDVLTWSRVGQ